MARRQRQLGRECLYLRLNGRQLEVIGGQQWLQLVQLPVDANALTPEIAQEVVMAIQTAAYWDVQAARAIEAASDAHTEALRLGYLEMAISYKQLAAQARTLERCEQEK
jgi:hypothetical protein